jgi:DNA-binding SARP family transcriptional activator
MARLSIRLLGPFQVTLDGEPVTSFESDKVRALLAYLAAEPDRPHRREALAGLLWSDYPERSARANVRRALANLRKTIGDRQATPSFLCISRQTIQFNSASDAWGDVTAFAELLEAKDQAPLQLEEAVALYRGAFLEGFSIGDSALFEEWALLKRERLRRQILTALHRLVMHHGERGAYGRALPHAWQRVELDPWREQAHRQLIRLLALNGQRGAALTQYEVCRRNLAEQLGVEPAAETTRLYEQIRDGERVDWSEAEGHLLAHEAEVALPRQSVEPIPNVPLPAQWRTNGGRKALIWGGLLFLIIVGLVAIFFAARGWFVGARGSETFMPPEPGVVQVEGGKIVQVCGSELSRQLCAYDAQTSQRLLRTNLEFEAIMTHGWSPDGEQILFSAGSEPQTGRLDLKLYIINADGSDLRQITHGDVNDMMAIWSPDGEWIVFNRDNVLWIICPDGSEARVLFREDESLVGTIAWAPDSQRIALWLKTEQEFVSLDEIWVIDRKGNVVQIVHSFERPLNMARLAWDPQGQDILCHCDFDDGAQGLLFDTNAPGSEPSVIEVIPHSWFPDFWPQWGGAE